MFASYILSHCSRFDVICICGKCTLSLPLAYVYTRYKYTFESGTCDESRRAEQHTMCGLRDDGVLVGEQMGNAFQMRPDRRRYFSCVWVRSQSFFPYSDSLKLFLMICSWCSGAIFQFRIDFFLARRTFPRYTRSHCPAATNVQEWFISTINYKRWFAARCCRTAITHWTPFAGAQFLRSYLPNIFKNSKE